MRFLAIFSSLVRQIDLILHILNVLNGLNDMTIISTMFHIIKYAKKSQKCGLRSISRVWLPLRYFSIYFIQNGDFHFFGLKWPRMAQKCQNIKNPKNKFCLYSCRGGSTVSTGTHSRWWSYFFPRKTRKSISTRVLILGWVGVIFLPR